MSDISALLDRSMQKHRQAHQARQSRDGAAIEFLTEAAQLRIEADALDPAHADAAWTIEQTATPKGTDTHTALMAFYRQQLGPL